MGLNIARLAVTLNQLANVTGDSFGWALCLYCVVRYCTSACIIPTLQSPADSSIACPLGSGFHLLGNLTWSFINSARTMNPEFPDTCTIPVSYSTYACCFS